MDFIIDSITGIFDKAMGWIGDQISSALSRFFGRLFYYLTTALTYLVNIVYRFFGIFSGMEEVSYDGEKQYLINIFFGNEKVTDVYWGMALIGFALIIAFAIIAVIRKSFDLEEKQQQSIGGILWSAAKSLLIIVALSAVMTAVLNVTNLLVKQVNYLFDNAGEFNRKDSMEFTDEQFATMARVYNTIGNYSVNESNNSRYNLTSCYNSIRADLYQLKKEGVFDFYYDRGTNGENKSWQSELQRLVKASDPRYPLPMDTINENTSQILLEIMSTLKTDKSFKPLASIKLDYVSTAQDSVEIDRVIFLSGTMSAAKNGMYNEDPHMLDAVRGPYYNGERSIYNFSQVSEDFEISFAGINYLAIILAAFFTLKNLVVCSFHCIARIFNLLGLYLIGPPMAATTPLDGGEKFKQWITAMVIQAFGIFGSIIPMRLVILFIPMVMDAKLVLFGDSATMNVLAKVLLIIGAMEAASRFNGILTGILADNAGWQSIQAGDMNGYAQNFMGRAAKFAGGVASGAARTTANVTGLGAAGRYIGGKVSGAVNYMNEKGGLIVGGIRGIRDLSRRSSSSNPPEQSSGQSAGSRENPTSYAADRGSSEGAVGRDGNRSMPPDVAGGGNPANLGSNHKNNEQ